MYFLLGCCWKIVFVMVSLFARQKSTSIQPLHFYFPYILGDFNYDLKVSPSTDHKVNKYLHTISSHGFEQIIKDITRVGRSSTGGGTETIINHILCNDTCKVCPSGVIPFGLSDHYPIFCSRKGFKYTFSTHNTVDIRSMKNYNVEAFCNLLDDCDWSPVLGSDCVDTAWSEFRSILIGIIASRKIVRLKQRTEPWMSSSIIDNIRMRDNISHLIKNGSPDVSFIDFAYLRNSIQRDVKKAKTNYIRSKLDENIGQPKKNFESI